jgi:hypothetical protein
MRLWLTRLLRFLTRVWAGDLNFDLVKGPIIK